MERISIHALREEGDLQDRRLQLGKAISIHALREEGDGMPLGVEPSQQISIHALREEGDVDQAYCLTLLELFLSTPSARRATACSRRSASAWLISIHALREEGDGH